MNQQQDDERAHYLCQLLDKALMAARDGYFTSEDIQAIQREFGLAPHSTH